MRSTRYTASMDGAMSFSFFLIFAVPQSWRPWRSIPVSHYSWPISSSAD